MHFLFQKLASSILFSLLTALLFHTTQAATTSLPNNHTFPAMIVFGDSIVDSGNNNLLNTIAKCNFPPYGEDFIGGKPTGRFSNGKIPSDILAEQLGIKELMPAYLDPTLQIQDLLTGVSFASGVLHFISYSILFYFCEDQSVLSLSDQLKMFKEYIGRLKVAVGEDRTMSILSKSIFLVCTGSNDIMNTYYTTPFRRNYNISGYTDLMVRSASSFFKEIYDLGARRICVLSLPPIGCVPSKRTVGGGTQRECVERDNKAAELFNSKLSSELNSLNNKLPHTKLVYVDIYTPLLAIIQNPEPHMTINFGSPGATKLSNFEKLTCLLFTGCSSGFEVVNKGCCGTGNIEAVILCRVLNPFSCTDVSKYLFWDSFHPTQRAYNILTLSLMKYTNSFFCGDSPC
ncbi:hypothetical protein HHK36_002930 [Tetracentron sinense]|uniref:Uncharacterized protein n=1 Tax=Tetracentron sinense TaxID=13715 RepID=A0A835DNU6_TETSI|nr:hypothetical protein HHK36_002930 [Tetracentron sinense]